MIDTHRTDNDGIPLRRKHKGPPPRLQFWHVVCLTFWQILGLILLVWLACPPLRFLLLLPTAIALGYLCVYICWGFVRMEQLTRWLERAFRRKDTRRFPETAHGRNRFFCGTAYIELSRHAQCSFFRSKREHLDQLRQERQQRLAAI